MVSFWPFKGHDTSAASFEKLLSALSAKINKESARNDALRQTQRRYRALWTLYTSFAYLVAATILVLVTGLSNCTALEYTGLCGAPVVIYAVRAALNAYFNYRVAASQAYLAQLNQQRDDAITKLKEATKYNSTQQLLDKYGGSTPPRPAAARPAAQLETPTKKQSAPVRRTGIAPPPTANIPGRQLPPHPPTSPPLPMQLPPTRPPQPPQQTLARPDDGAEFAPNAFSAPPRRTQDYASGGPRWYDRLMDVVLGDDETQPKNRIVLLCQKCRLVNGQAPPGTPSLEDVGPWRCSACHAWNGQESEAKQMIRKIAGDEATKPSPEIEEKHASEQTTPIGAHEESDDDDEEGVAPPSGSTRSKTRLRKKN